MKKTMVQNLNKLTHILKIPLFLLFLLSSAHAEKIEVTLREFALLTATQNKVNILIQEAIEDDKSTFLIGGKDETIFLPAFKKMLYLKGFNVKQENNFYFIEKIPEKVEKIPEPIKDVFHSITLKNIVFEDIENLLKLHEAKYSYIKSTNTVAFFCRPEYLEKIKNQISALDVSFPQIQFKITILETNLNELKDRGANISAYFQTINSSASADTVQNQSYNYFLNLITMPYTANSNVLANSKSGFYGVLKYLNQNGFTEIKNSPIVTARSHSEASFSSGQNIPYLVQSSSFTSATATKNDSYAYKDVGLKIVLKPVIINDLINFDLSLTLEDLVSNSTSLTPTTSKKELKSSYTLQKGELLILSGINKTTQLDSSFGIPLMQDIWFLGNLFKFESKSLTQSVITITIEVL